MVVPPWLTFLVAGTVIAFGLYRLRLALRSEEEGAPRRKGVFGQSRRTQAIRGSLYLLLGVILLADLLGVATNPFRLLMPEQSEPAPAPDDAVQVMPRPAPAPASEAPASN